jgi:AraC-like DNA-binding protein
MYLDALSFLEDERDGFGAYEALAGLTDEQLETPVADAHGWSGRDLMSHILAWQAYALASAKELAVNETSPTIERLEAAWNASPDAGDRINDEELARYRAMPLDELRRQFADTAGELRGYLTVVPESRWIKHAKHQEWFFGETTEHYEDHLADLRAILAAAGA